MTLSPSPSAIFSRRRNRIVRILKKTKTKAKSTAKKKTAVKKTAAKKPAAKAAKKGAMKFPNSNKPRTKTETYSLLAEASGLAKKDIATVFDALSGLIGQDLKKGPGMFTLPGLMKIRVVHKPAVKARKGTNPFTGEEMMFKAKPAHNVVKVRPLKALKDKV